MHIIVASPLEGACAHGLLVGQGGRSARRLPETDALYEYDAFGNIITKAGTLANDFTFSTQLWYGASGWSMYMFRNYSPRLGRWTQREPLGFIGGLNLYAFCGNNPASRVDVGGLLGTNSSGYQGLDYLGDYYDDVLDPYDNPEADAGTSDRLCMISVPRQGDARLDGLLALGGSIALGAGGVAVGVGLGVIAEGVAAGGLIGAGIGLGGAVLVTGGLGLAVLGGYLVGKGLGLW